MFQPSLQCYEPQKRSIGRSAIGECRQNRLRLVVATQALSDGVNTFA